MQSGVNLPRLAMASLAAGLLVFTSLLAQALPEDTEQPIHISADEAIRDERTGETIYRGNVQMNQGTLRIDADEVTIYRIDIEADKIVAVGAPAHMQQLREVGGEIMHAEGDIIEYYKVEERVQLRENARLEQDGSTVQGDKIDYFINEQLVKAIADRSVDEKRRVEVVIPPHKVNDE